MTIGVMLGTGWKDQIGDRLNPLCDHMTRRERHLYDGWTVEQVVAPILRMTSEGVDTLILTNACGAVNLDLEIGEVVCISDHINLTGVCPPVGFQPLANVYTAVPDLRRGVFAQVKGPAFETPAECRMLRTLGADVVGMSTAVEAIAAHNVGCQVIGLSLVTDYAGTDDGHPQVLKAAGKVDLAAVLGSVVAYLSASNVGSVL